MLMFHARVRGTMRSDGVSADGSGCPTPSRKLARALSEQQRELAAEIQTEKFQHAIGVEGDGAVPAGIAASVQMGTTGFPVQHEIFLQRVDRAVFGKLLRQVDVGGRLGQDLGDELRMAHQKRIRVLARVAGVFGMPNTSPSGQSSLPAGLAMPLPGEKLAGFAQKSAQLFGMPNRLGPGKTFVRLPRPSRTREPAWGVSLSISNATMSVDEEIVALREEA